MYHQRKNRSYSHFKPHQASPGAAFVLLICKIILYGRQFFKLPIANMSSTLDRSVFQLSTNLYAYQRTQKAGVWGRPAPRRAPIGRRHTSVERHASGGGVAGVRRRAGGVVPSVGAVAWTDGTEGQLPLAASKTLPGSRGLPPGKIGRISAISCMAIQTPHDERR